MTVDSPTREILSVGLKYGLVGSIIAIGLFFAMKGLGENPLIWTVPKMVVYLDYLRTISTVSVGRISPLPLGW